MRWPSDSEYFDALQHPQAAFSDPDLRTAAIEADRMGLPKARSGNFAIVFKAACGGREWAVKCFKHDLADRRERYAAIHAHLNRVNLPFMSRFFLLERGVCVRGHWYPVLKMEWASGELLREWVERRLSRPNTLRALADQWLQVVNGLRRAGIGHGDLQHGNVVIANDQIRLIDYDSMFVPALAGRSCPELGHDNYQHPKRSQRHFGPYIDDFSAWVIYVSLIALSIEPRLWRRYSSGQEALLFRRADFLDVEGSAVFRELLRSTDPRVRALASSLDSLLASTPDALPELGGGIVTPADDEMQRLAGSSEQGWRPAVDRDDEVQEWWRDQANPQLAKTTHEVGETGRAAVKTAVGTDLSWVFESLRGLVPPKRFDEHFFVERLVVALSMLGLIAVAIYGGIVDVMVGVALASTGNAGFWLIRYIHHPARQERRSHRRQLATLRARSRRVTNARQAQLSDQVISRRAFSNAQKRWLRRKQQFDKRFASRMRKATKPLEATLVSLRNELRDLQVRRQTQVASTTGALAKALAAERQQLASLPAEEGRALSDLARRERDEFYLLNTRLTTEIDSLRGMIAASSGEETKALTGALAAYRDGFVQDIMSGESVASATIPGIGPSLKERLQAAGIMHASDVQRGSLRRIPRFGRSRVAAMLMWKGQVEQKARQRAPQNLPSVEQQSVMAAHRGQRTAWQAQIALKQDELARGRRGINQAYDAERTNAARQFSERRKKHGDQIAVLDQELNRSTQAIDDAFTAKHGNLEASVRVQESAVNKARQQVASAFQQERDGLETERVQIAAEEARQAKEHADMIAQLKQEESSLTWQRAKAEHQYQAYDRINVVQYARAIFGAGK